MGLYARYPIALAPGMGQNAFFVSVIMTLTAAGRANGWQTALGIVFVSGLAFVALSLVEIRNMILNALSVSLRNSIAVGIGLFIALIGLKNSGIILAHPATFIQLNPAGPLTIDSAVFWLGFLVTAMLLIRGVPEAILWGILCATALAALGGQLQKPATYLGLPRKNVFF
jgi:AGZA family xanthine/uracil permease-like MFS transporter